MKPAWILLGPISLFFVSSTASGQLQPPKPKMGLVVPNGDKERLFLIFALVTAEKSVLDDIDAEAKRIHCPPRVRRSQAAGLQMTIFFSSEVSPADALVFIEALRAQKFGPAKVDDIAVLPASAR